MSKIPKLKNIDFQSQLQISFQKVPSEYKNCHPNLCSTSHRKRSHHFSDTQFWWKAFHLEWSDIAKSLCDLKNTLITCKDWDPTELHAPNQNMVPKNKILDDYGPFGMRCELAIDIPVNPRGQEDLYVNNSIGLMVDIQNSGNNTRLERESLLAIHTVA